MDFKNSFEVSKSFKPPKSDASERKNTYEKPILKQRSSFCPGKKYLLGSVWSDSPLGDSEMEILEVVQEAHRMQMHCLGAIVYATQLSHYVFAKELKISERKAQVTSHGHF